MKQWVLLGVLTLLLVASCGTTKVLPQERYVTKLERVEKWRIETVTLTLPKDSVAVVTPDTTSRLEIRAAVSEAAIIDGKLYHSLYSNPDYKPTVDVPVKDTETTKDSVVTKTIPVETERDFTWEEKIRLKSFWWLVTGVLGFGGWTFRKPIMRLIKRLV